MGISDEAHYLAKDVVRLAKEDEARVLRNKAATIGQLNVFIAILKDRNCDFKESRSRKNALSLLMIVDLIWQVARDFTGKKSELNSHLTREEVSQAQICLDWVNSCMAVIRHPSQKPTSATQLDLLLADPWSDGESQKLINAADSARILANALKSAFSPCEGFEGEIDRKASPIK